VTDEPDDPEGPRTDRPGAPHAPDPAVDTAGDGDSDPEGAGSAADRAGAGASLGRDPHLPAPGSPPPDPLDRVHLLVLIGPIIALVICTNIGNALFPTLSTENPLLLIALGAPNRNLIIASAQVPFVPYFVIGFLRLLAPDYFFYALGAHYGDRAISWMEQRTPTVGKMMRQLERVFGRAGHVLVLIMPNNPVCLLAGAARMRPRVFWTLNIVGTVGRLLLMWWIGILFQGWIDAFLGFVADHRIPLLVVTVGLVAFSGAREWRAGSSEIQQLIELEEELVELDLLGDTEDPTTPRPPTPAD
jgi:membrane protein DedA with SNARE-associated domain